MMNNPARIAINPNPKVIALNSGMAISPTTFESSASNVTKFADEQVIL